ncbi:MAG: hypothetical protein QQW96_03735 [Tychonema bourrellyi B0820]|nr:hypothetical protein [Tychonema bourrellyi B0820]PJE45247.1 MAG: hypothetical protein CUR32_01205 [Flavobacterium sp.] [Flavobacterium sp. FEMGT703F]
MNRKKVKVKVKVSKRDEIMSNIIGEPLIKAVRSDRTYKMPEGYISWEKLSNIVAISLYHCCHAEKTDSMGFVNSYRTGLWFAQKSPIYCLTTSLGESFDKTDSLSKRNAMAGWQPSLPSFIVALPKDLITTPGQGKLDYLVISCVHPDHPEWDSYRWEKIEVKATNEKYDRLYFQICTVDSHGIVWNTASPVNDLGDIEPCYAAQDTLSETDNVFLDKLKNLAINILLALEFSPSLFSDVTKSETLTKKGFAVSGDRSKDRYPRWLGKNYHPKSVSKSTSGTHSSPCIHWRRGHWRLLEEGKGKWKQTKRLWIEPVLVNSLTY